MNKIIILLGQRVRSGTNFIGSTLGQHPDIVTLPLSTSLGEFNLFKDNSIELCYDKISKDSFGLNFTSVDKTIFLKNYGKSWIQLLIKKYNIPQDKTIFIKSPYLDGFLLWKTVFPDSKIAIICRDGRDNVISSVKASNDKRSWHKINKSLKKRINFYSGRYFINHTKEWKRTAKNILKIEESSRVSKFKYEDLINSENNIIDLLNYYGLEVTESIVNKCLEAPVMGSSFGIQADGIVKPNWKPDFDKSKFIFTNKWKKWSLQKKIIFRLIAGPELIKLGYENNNNW